MRDILKEIVVQKKEIVARAKEMKSIFSLKQEISYGNFSMSHLFEQKSWTLIAECKLQSPAKGRLTKSHSVVELAHTYEENGASMISVHTDPHFLGKNEDFISIRQQVELPLLRKDFIIDPYQIYESRWLGADAILLIVRILTPEELKQLLYLTWSLGMDALVEAHDKGDLEIALSTPADYIGINNRNLVTFETDIQTTLDILPTGYPDRTFISESGIFSESDINLLSKAGCDGILVGEGLVKATDIARQTKIFSKT